MKSTDESVVDGVFGTWRAVVQDHIQKERGFKLSFQAPGGNGPCGTLMGTVAALSPGMTQEGRCASQSQLRQCCPFPEELAESCCHPLSSKVHVHLATRMENPSCSRPEIPQWMPLELHHCNKSHPPCKASPVPVLFVWGLNVVIPFSACVYIRGRLPSKNKVQATPLPMSYHGQSPLLQHFWAWSHLMDFSIEQHQRSLRAFISS